MEALVARGDRAFVDEDFDEAVIAYTEALALQPGNATIYDSRAYANLKLENFLEAVEDASKAIELNPTLPKAYLRKGIASFKLEEYEAALEAFEAGAKLAPENSQFKTWIRKCQAEIDEEKEVPAPSEPSPSQQSTPAVTSPSSVLPSASSQPAQPLGPAAGGTSAAPPISAALANAAPAPYQGKYRHQYYQMQNRVTVDVFAKGLAKEQVHVFFQPQHLTVVIREADSDKEDYSLDVDLYGEVLPDQCRYEVLKTKIEVVMVKKDDKLNWGSLEKSDKVAAPNYSNPTAPPVAGQYPSSYTKAPKDWSKVEHEVKEMEEKGELADGDPLNDFFKKIFSQGDEDQRRAMMKSFVESNGTVLSTNWQEVGAKKVECTPPDGMVVKKWKE